MAESESTGVLEGRSWTELPAGLGPEEWARRSDPKGVVSGRGAGVLKGQQGKGRRVRAGARSLARGPGEGYRDPGGGNHRAPSAPIEFGEQSNSLSLPKEREGARFRVPREAVSAYPRDLWPSPDPPRSRRSVRDSAASVGRGRSRSRNPDKILPASLGLVRQDFLTFPLAILAATTQETQAGPPISFGLERGLLGVVVLRKIVDSEKFAKLGNQRWRLGFHLKSSSFLLSFSVKSPT